MIVSGATSYGFLVWNLFLAWVPLAAAGTLHLLERHGLLTAWRACGLLALWLLFFPNSALHRHRLPSSARVPRRRMWFDIVVLTVFAWTGMMLGFTSLYWVQDFLRGDRPAPAGRPSRAPCWRPAGSASISDDSRLNSWDMLVRPASTLSHVLERVLDPLSHPRTMAVTLCYGSFLILAYLTLAAFIAAANRLAREGGKTCPPSTTPSHTP